MDKTYHDISYNGVRYQEDVSSRLEMLNSVLCVEFKVFLNLKVFCVNNSYEYLTYYAHEVVPTYKKLLS